MTFYAWCSRRAGGLSVIALLALCYWVISRESTHQRQEHKHEDPTTHATYYTSPWKAGAGYWTYVFAYYCLFIHALVFMVPFRACWSIWNLTQFLKRASQSSALSQLKQLSLQRRNSSNSISSSETLISHYIDGSSSTTSEAGDIDPELYTEGSDSATEQVVHAVIIPNYKEEYDTLRETLEVLASHPRAHDSYDVSRVFIMVLDLPGNTEC